MANAERGEASIEVGGRTYTLRPTFNSCCEVENLTGIAFPDLLKLIQEGRLSGMRAVAWMMLHELHADEIATLRDAGNWIEQAGDSDRVLEAMYRALNLNLTAAVEASAGKPRGRPRKAQAGSTASSSAAPAVSA